MKFARLVAAFLLLAQPVLAQSPNLRGAQSSATEARARPNAPVSGAVINGQSETADAPPRPLAPPAPPLPMSSADQAPAQCSASCSRDYYACLAGGNADLCASIWGQCRAVCDSTARRSAR
jgi:hypothetical protein